jgi:hypothetical protein
MARVIRDQPSAFQARERAQQHMPLDWVRGVERLHCLPAQAGVPQHQWGAFLNDFDRDTVVWEGMSNPVPGGSARKSAAIIPFVNESLTSGAPIGPTKG